MAGVLIRRQGLYSSTLLHSSRSAGIAGLASTLQLLRSASSAPAVQPRLREDQSKEAPKPAEVVYEGVMAPTLRRVKILSFSSFVFSSLGAPVLAFHTYPEVSVVVKTGIASLMIMVSALTTAGLHWFAGPYVRKLTWRPGAREIQVETLNMLARPVQYKFQLGDIQPPDTNKPLATFYAKGNHFYIEEENFPSSELLKKLVKK